MRLRNILVFGAMALLSGRASLAQDSSPGDASPVDTSGAIELPEVEVEAVSGNANTSAMQAFQDKMNAMDQSRDNFLLPKFGATSYNMDREAIEALPQGDNTPIDKVLLQAPGVSYDSAVSNPDFHVRNEYANVQYRINGILLPEGVSGLGPVLETGFIGNLNLLDWSAASPIWAAHRRCCRPHNKERVHAGREFEPVRGQLWDRIAELQLWRKQRRDPIFRHRPIHAEQRRSRKCNADR